MRENFLGEEDLQRIFEHATKEYPLECCGIVTGRINETGGNIVHPCANIQNRLHGERPAEYPRDARTAYYLDPDEFVGILRTLKGTARCLKAFYHSHTENKAYFSEEDRKRALLWGEPAYPGARYIVLAVNGGRVEALKVFVWDEGMRDFKEEKMITGKHLFNKGPEDFHV